MQVSSSRTRVAASDSLPNVTFSANQNLPEATLPKKPTCQVVRITYQFLFVARISGHGGAFESITLFLCSQNQNTKTTNAKPTQNKMNTKTISLLFALFVAQASASLRHGKNANRALVEEVEEEFCEATYYVYKAKELKESKIKKSGKEFSAPLYKMLDDNTYVPAGIYTSILNYVHDEEGLCMSTTMVSISNVDYILSLMPGR